MALFERGGVRTAATVLVLWAGSRASAQPPADAQPATAAPEAKPVTPTPPAKPATSVPKRTGPTGVLRTVKAVQNMTEALEVTLWAPAPGLSKPPTLRVWRGNNSLADFDAPTFDAALQTYTWKVEHDKPWMEGTYRVSVRDEAGILPIPFEVVGTPEAREIDLKRAWGVGLDGLRPLPAPAKAGESAEPGGEKPSPDVLAGTLARETLDALAKRSAAGVCVLVSADDELSALHAVHDTILAQKVGGGLDTTKRSYLAFFTQPLPPGVGIRLDRVVVGTTIISVEWTLTAREEKNVEGEGAAGPSQALGLVDLGQLPAGTYQVRSVGSVSDAATAGRVDATVLARIARSVSAGVRDPRVPDPVESPKGGKREEAPGEPGKGGKDAAPR